MALKPTTPRLWRTLHQGAELKQWVIKGMGDVLLTIFKFGFAFFNKRLHSFALIF